MLQLTWSETESSWKTKGLKQVDDVFIQVICRGVGKTRKQQTDTGKFLVSLPQSLLAKLLFI